jgi:hypothetical protein
MNNFAFEGDVEGVDASVITFDKAQLAITMDAMVPVSIARTQQLLDAQPTIDILGLYTASVANTRTTKCRIGACISFDLMEMVLVADLTARQAYELIIPALVDTGYEAICEPLVDFLTVALVKPYEDNIPPLTLQPCVGIAGYVPSTRLVSHRRQNYLYRDLPGLIPASATTSSSDPALVNVSRGMRDMVIEARLHRNERSDARDVTRLPRTARDSNDDALTDCMLMMCWVEHDEYLPQVYHEWDARPRGVSERYTLQQSVEFVATIIDVPSFEVNPTKVMAFKNFWYAGSSYFYIGSGLLPFSITPTNATSVQARAMLAADRVRADALDLGADPKSGAVAPGEVSCLLKLNGYNPQTWNEARSQLLGMQALMGAFLGPAQPVAGTYGPFLRKFSRMLTRLEFEIDHVHGPRLGPSIMMFHVQLAWRNWMVA